ncbi:pyridoxamine 5'-phosphate oxidase family protein [Aeromicrobium terrae]|uniref:Pyridoxamine 5'-phosphate oxidase family protein n=1 Tax=Aeromicrobium terrae TaxID=2498846 RepID=A0A5C8NGL5_9ACTN|nr:pyridoxamine 5'-phosphate oxidase family protein [Aeromicrobium terrae]TXL57760.1 pyridoxamine 5'-phosphate oxidase family protein [Aeromicrobium terrae]
MTDTGAMAERVLGAITYMVLATADADGTPWATPVWFAREGDDFYWVSRPGAQHSRNIAERPDVSLVVFDSTVAVGSASSFYARARAGLVPDGELAGGVAVFAAECDRQGIGAWTVDDVTGDAELRLYRASITAAWVLAEDGGPDRRLDVPWPAT